MVRILDKMEEYAIENNIPIMMKDGIEFLTNYIKENNVKNILEIGSAIGYSAIRMALVSSDIYVTTIERDETRYNEAIKNIKEANLGNQINIILDDAFNVDIDFKFDLIFIDAAKAQYIKFFEKFKNNLSSDGVIVSDNLKFHGLVDTTEHIESRNVRQLVRKLKNYIDFLENNKEFETTFYDLGDGVAVSRKK
ncbi:MAG: O-methyltransferase [Bacilli bacterium]|nr:O-methyltransferase [Bacilli bacterium]